MPIAFFNSLSSILNVNLEPSLPVVWLIFKYFASEANSTVLPDLIEFVVVSVPALFLPFTLNEIASLTLFN